MLIRSEAFPFMSVLELYNFIISFSTGICLGCEVTNVGMRSMKRSAVL